MTQQAAKSYTTRDGLRLQRYFWAAEPSRATLLICHGYAEHGRRYQRLAEVLNQHGISVLCYDQRGHGISQGLPAYVPRFQLLVDDLAGILEAHPASDSPLFIMGHSMGGAVLAHLAARNPSGVAGLIFSSAALRLVGLPGPILTGLSAVSSALLPRAFVPRFIYRFDSTAISSVPEEVEAYDLDPHVYHGPLRNRTGWELKCMSEALWSKVHELKLPVLLLHGDADRITDMRGSHEFHEKVAATDKEIAIFPGGFHELFNDRCREEVTERLVFWLENQLGSIS